MDIIYARQSIDKKDSISIEMQIETCKAKLKQSQKIKVLYDRGFSGKNTNRPAFQELLRLVKSNDVEKIVVYKLDRISRSLLDFLKIKEFLEQHKTEFISCLEEFDTSTPMGKLMVNIAMSFAEMERETIQQRITDNYYARGEKGYYLGGYAPFGYKKVETMHNGKKTYTFEEISEESEIINKIYQEYSDGKSMMNIAKELNAQKIKTKNNGAWSQTTISRILRNPIYVKANADIYDYLQSKGATLNNTIEDYIGENGCLYYGNPLNRKGTKFKNMDTDYVTLGLHKGIIEPKLWLTVQDKINKKVNHSNLGHGSLSWLQGIVKCECGRTLYAHKTVNHNKTAKNSQYYYFYCKGKKEGSCNYFSKTIPVNKIEKIIEQEIFKELFLIENIKTQKLDQKNPKENELKIKLIQIDKKISNLIEQLAWGNRVSMDYINETISKLDKEKQSILDNIFRLQLNADKSFTINIKNIINDWNQYPIDVKKNTVKNLISKIVIDGDEIKVFFV